MAFEKQWIALLNVCRQRPSLKLADSVVHQGHYAVEWAVLHGELGIAQELLYWLQVNSNAEYIPNKALHVKSIKSLLVIIQQILAFNALHLSLRKTFKYTAYC
jgi:hypothetical protein